MVEKYRSTKARRANHRLKKILEWQKDSPENLLHIDQDGTAAERARRQLAHLNSIAGCDDDDKEASLMEGGLQASDADPQVDGDALLDEKVS